MPIIWLDIHEVIDDLIVAKLFYKQKIYTAGWLACGGGILAAREVCRSTFSRSFSLSLTSRMCCCSWFSFWSDHALAMLSNADVKTVSLSVAHAALVTILPWLCECVMDERGAWRRTGIKNVAF